MSRLSSCSSITFVVMLALCILGCVPGFAWAQAAPERDMAVGRSLVAQEDDEPQATVADGVYSIACASAKRVRVDVADSSGSDGANVLLAAKKGAQSQKWYIKHDKDNYYTAFCLTSMKVLDVQGEGDKPGTNVIQYRHGKTDNQKWQIRKNDDGTFTFVSKSCGLALTADSAACLPGANVKVDVDRGLDSQKFVFKRVTLLANGVYSIASRVHVSCVLDVPGATTKSSTQLMLYGYNHGLNQKYLVKNEGNNVCTIQVLQSGKRLAARAGKVVQVSRGGSKAQRWRVSWDENGIVLTNLSSGKVMTVAGEVQNGAVLSVGSAQSSVEQRFVFTPRPVMENGMFTVKSAVGNRMLDVKYGSKKDDATLLLWQEHDGNNQKFQFTRLSDDNFKIVNVRSGKAVGAYGADVRQGSYIGAATQQWRAVASPKGGIVFANRASGKVLDVYGNRNADGANVGVAARTDTKGQRWTVAPTVRTIEDEALERAQEKAESKSSATNYLITVDLTHHRVIVFNRSGGSWSCVRNMTVSTGAPSTPTVRGDYTVGLRGYSFGSGFTCYYWTQFYGNYLFHSVLYYEGTRSIMDGRLGYSISHGCVRMDINDAKWIYDNIPTGTKVSVYY